MTVHVFAGPSLSGSPVLDLPGVCAHPPIAHGDLYAVRLGPGDVVLVVDGVYQHTAPVRHKEILHLSSAGVGIYGTASLGALRACEHQGHGMRGLGSVFAWYRDGRLISDADVALAHGDEDVDFRAFTHALVSILSVVDRLTTDGRIEPRDATRVVELARSVHFSTRTNLALLASARTHGLQDLMRLVVEELPRDRMGDIKRIDAEQAVRQLVHRAGAPAPVHGSDVPVTSYSREWRLQHTPATPGADGPTERQVLACAQLFLGDYPEKHTTHVIANLRAEYPELEIPTGDGSRLDLAVMPAWLEALTPSELVRRHLLSPAEATTLNARDRALRVLVRTFRRRSGRLVYEELPPEILPELPALIRESSRLLRLNDQAVRTNPRFHPGDIPTGELDATFAQLWTANDLAISVLDRGFRSLEDFREHARPYYVAARAVVAISSDRATAS